MTSDERTTVRKALLLVGFNRTGSTSDDGSGVYDEVWRHRDGSAITLSWGPREHLTERGERCWSCAAVGPWFKTEGNARHYWNLRAAGAKE